MEALPSNQRLALQKWLTLPEYRLLCELVGALAVKKEVEAAAHLADALDNQGAAEAQARLARSEARNYERMIELLEQIRSGENFEYARAKVTIPTLL